MACRYFAPNRPGVLDLAPAERRAVHQLAEELVAAGGEGGARDFIRASRRWADEVGADRINATFVRMNSSRIERRMARSRSEEEAAEKEREAHEARKKQYQREEERAAWARMIREELKGLPEATQQEYMERALEAVDGADPEDPKPWHRVAAQAIALKLFAEDHDLPGPPNGG